MTAAPTPVPPASQPSAADPTTAAAAVSTNTSSDVSGSTTVSSLSDLKNQAPKVYYQMMVSIATNMISDMHRRDEHLKEIMREARDSDKA